MSSVIAPSGNVATEDALRKILDPVDIIDWVCIYLMKAEIYG